MPETPVDGLIPAYGARKLFSAISLSATGQCQPSVNIFPNQVICVTGMTAFLSPIASCHGAGCGRMPKVDCNGIEALAVAMTGGLIWLD